MSLNLFFFLFRKSEKGTHVSEFRFSFLRGKEKGTRVYEFHFFFSAKRKKQRAFLNFVFLFSAERKKEIRRAKLISHFPVGQSTVKSAEIHFLEN